MTHLAARRRIEVHFVGRALSVGSTRRPHAVAMAGENMRMTVFAAIAAIYACACSAQEARELRERLDALQQEQVVAAPVGSLPNTCGSAPLPLTPVGPRVQTIWQERSSTDPFTVTAWRLPCSATDSMIVLTLQPNGGSNPSFLCGVDLTLLQSGGLQTDELYFRTDPLTSSSFCGDVIAPVSVAITPRSTTPANFDFDQGFTIDFNASLGHQTLAMFAYDPTQYALTPPAGPDAVEVRVRGAGPHFRNCQVSVSAVGGGQQYTASCASETPLKAGGFERYDY